MIWEEFPHYCGGRILKGLWDKDSEGLGWSDEKLAKDIMDKHEPILVGSFEQAEGNVCIPNSLLVFQQILKFFCKGDNHAIILAITADLEQELAQKHLEATGFERQGTYTKFGGNQCSLWIGDYQNKIKDILYKVPDYGKTEVLPEKKPVFATRPTPPPATPRRTIDNARLRAAENTLRRSSGQTPGARSGTSSSRRETSTSPSLTDYW